MLVPLLRGEKVWLNALTSEDVSLLARWYEDSNFARLFDASAMRPRNEEALRKWLENALRDPHSFQFAIRLKDSREMIGLIDIGDVDWNHGTGWLGIAIGEEANRGKGYGTEATRLMVDYAFQELNLHSIRLTVFSYNLPAIAVYEKLGFQYEGAHREFLHRDGRRYDMLIYSLLRYEWKG